MWPILFILLIGSSVGRQIMTDDAPFIVLDALEEAYIVELQELQMKDRTCFAKFEKFLAGAWNDELNHLNVSDMKDVPTFWEYSEPSKPKYNTVWQEWFMDAADPIDKLNTCIRDLAKGVDDRLDNETRICTKMLIDQLLEQEKSYDYFTRELFNDTRELPFRDFLNFLELKEVMFQNRSIDNLTSHENNVYVHVNSFLISEEDRQEKTWLLQQECDWNNLKALLEAPSEEKLYKEFQIQVRRIVNQQLSSQLVRYFNLNATLDHSKYASWFDARRKMLTEINSTVEKLKSGKKDALWLCEYAFEIATRFAREQANILLTEERFYFDLETDEVTSKTRSIEKQLASLNDSRQMIVEPLANRFKDQSNCIRTFAEMITNHQLDQIATFFIDERLAHPEMFCKQVNINLGLLAPQYCKCFGSFCVSHSIAALFAERYELRKDEKGVYNVSVISFEGPTKKVVSWPGNKEI